MNLHRVALLVTAAAIAFASELALAHEFSAPVVTIEVSKLEPGGHPNLQTTIDTPTGAGFDQVMIISPKGTSIAEDAQIPDGTVVGRLDAEATTNALTRPTCDVHVTFSVPIVEATTDLSADDYPQYLKDLAPGRHRLRLIADVSPSPEVPIVINYLFDLDLLTQSVVSRVFVGDPDSPALQLKTCTPQKSVNTLFGMTPIGTPLLTSPDPLPGELLPFKFVFTSRPDANGERHKQNVEVTASLAIGLAPTPTLSPGVVSEIESLPAPTGLSFEYRDANLGVFRWNDVTGAEEFLVEIIIADETVSNIVVPGPGIPLPSGLLPTCDEGVIYRVSIALRGAGAARIAELMVPPLGCTRLVAPDAGNGPLQERRSIMLAALSTFVGASLVATGSISRWSARSR